MNKSRVEIINIKRCAYNVLHVKTTKPENYDFIPGQATKIFIDQYKWRNEGPFFAFASIPDDNYLEFLVKTAMRDDIIVDKILNLTPGDKLMITNPIGNMQYKGEGTFIASGVGISPFISIFKDLKAKGKLGNNKLIYTNKSEADILFRKELEDVLGDDFINILQEETEDYKQGTISQDFLKDFALSPNHYFYLCSTPKMIGKIEKHLLDLGVDKELIII